MQPHPHRSLSLRRALVLEADSSSSSTHDTAEAYCEIDEPSSPSVEGPLPLNSWILIPHQLPHHIGHLSGLLSAVPDSLFIMEIHRNSRERAQGEGIPDWLDSPCGAGVDDLALGASASAASGISAG